MVTWLGISGPAVRQKGRKACFSPYGSQKTQSDRKGLGTKSVFPGHVPNDPLPSTRPHLPQFHHLPIVDSFCLGSNHFPKPHLWTLLALGPSLQYLNLLGGHFISNHNNYVCLPYRGIKTIIKHVWYIWYPVRICTNATLYPHPAQKQRKKWNKTKQTKKS
jgi:hypothetical protein